MTNEPVMKAGAIVAAIGAVLAMLVSLGIIQMSPDQQTAILTAAAAVLPLMAAVWSRQRVTPVADPKAENEQGELVELVPVDGSELKK